MQPQPQTPQQSGGGIMGTLSRIAPTALGIVGGIGGEIVDPFGGGVAGAALGSGIGKAFQNEAQGRGLGLGSDIGAAAEGGLGQATGDVGGALLGKLGGFLGGWGAKTAEKRALSDEFGNLTTSEKEDLNLANSVNLAKQAGIPATADHFASLPNVATGEVTGVGPEGTLDGIQSGILNGSLDAIVRQAHQEAGTGIDLTGFRDAVENAVNDRGMDNAITTGGRGGQPRQVGEGARVVSNLQRQLQQLGYGGTGSLSGETNPDGALSLLRYVQRVGRTFNNSLSGASEDKKYVFNKAEQWLKDKIYNDPAVKRAISNFKTTPEDDLAIANAVKNAGGSQDFAQFLSDTLNNANSASDITNVERQLIDMRDAGRAAQMRNAAKGVAQPPQATSPAQQLIGHAASGNKAAALGTLAHTGATKLSVPAASRLGGLLDRMSVFTGQLPSHGVLNKLPGALGTAVLTSPNVTAGAQGGPMAAASSTQPQAGANAGAGSSPEVQAYNTMLAMLTMDPYLSSSLASPIAGMAPTVTKMQAAQNILPSLQQAFQGAGGAQGPILGRLAQLGGLFGGPASAYAQEQAQARSILNSLGLPGLATPSLSQTPGAAGVTGAGLTGLLGALGGGGGAIGNIPAPAQ